MKGAFPTVRKSGINLFKDGRLIPVGCRIYGGELYPALSAELVCADVPQDIICVGYSAGAGKFLIVTGSGTYVTVNCASFLKFSTVTDGSAFCYEDYSEECAARCVAVCGDNTILYDKNGFAVVGTGTPVTCGAEHYGRLFGAAADDGAKLIWSGPDGVQDHAEGIYGGGYLHTDPERGDILDIISYGEKLVLVRSRGLTVMTVYGSPQNFAAESTDTDAEGVVKGTARVAGGKLLFCTSSGLCAYDGNGIKEIFHRLKDDMYAPERAEALGNRYFLGCTSRALKRRVILCYDADISDSYYIDLPADRMCAADCVYAFNSNGAYKLTAGDNWSLIAEDIDFGTDRKKTLTAIYAAGNINLTLSDGERARAFTDVCGTVRPRLRGKSFTLSVSGNGAVKNLTVTGETSYGL